jgi:hypothetical protein
LDVFLSLCNFYFTFSIIWHSWRWKMAIKSLTIYEQLQSQTIFPLYVALPFEFIKQFQGSCALGRTYGRWPSISSSHMNNLQLLAAYNTFIHVNNKNNICTFPMSPLRVSIRIRDEHPHWFVATTFWDIQWDWVGNRERRHDCR